MAAFFSLLTFNQQRSASNESQLTLLGLSLASSGKYSCEVSADAPSFHTMIVTGDLEVCGKCAVAVTTSTDLNYTHSDPSLAAGSALQHELNDGCT